MSSFEALLKTVDGLTQDEVKQLYNYLVENRLRVGRTVVRRRARRGEMTSATSGRANSG